MKGEFCGYTPFSLHAVGMRAPPRAKVWRGWREQDRGLEQGTALRAGTWLGLVSRKAIQVSKGLHQRGANAKPQTCSSSESKPS